MIYIIVIIRISVIKKMSILIKPHPLSKGLDGFLSTLLVLFLVISFGFTLLLFSCSETINERVTEKHENGQNKIIIKSSTLRPESLTTQSWSTIMKDIKITPVNIKLMLILETPIQLPL